MIFLANSGASNFVAGVDRAFIIILAISFFFLIGITAVMIYFIIRYNKKRNPKAKQIEGSNTLEVIWTVIPTILVMIMFYYGWAGWKPMKKNIPKDALTIKAMARMWQFSFQYENGRIMDSLYLPKDKPVVLDLEAADVIHSLYIPAFRVKEDMVPGKQKYMWFTPTKIGDYDLFCAEYCGLQHSYMISGVRVMEPEEFDAWLADTSRLKATPTGMEKPGMAGLEIIRKNGCNACHTADGSKLVGPSYLGLFGETQTVIVDGEEREITVDEEYLKRAIYDPNAEIVKGYPKGMMLSYKDLINEEELEEIITYLKTLGKQE